MTFRVQATLVVLSLAASAIAGSPGDAVLQAAADLDRVPVGARQYTRYFTAYNLQGADASEAGKVLAFWCNSLSREVDIERPVQVSPTLWRVDIRWYGWKKEVWERLATVDPYFHVLGEKAVEVEEFELIEHKEWIDHPGGRFRFPNGKIEDKDTPAGRYLTTWTEKRLKVKARELDVPQPAPWLPAKEYGYLALQMQSNLPVCRIDWFLYQTGIQEGRVAGYYDFLGVGKTEKEFQELVGADIQAAKRVKKEMAASVARSRVTLNNSGLERFSTLSGAYWRSQDYLSSTFKQNVVRLLDGDTEPPKGDASEQYGSLPNELFGFFLVNAKGERQNAAPSRIAGDGDSPSPNKNVEIGVSCVRCHLPGIQPINDWMRNVHTEKASLALGSPDYEKYRRLKQLYLSDLSGRIEADQKQYAAAVFKCNGMTSQANATAVGKIWTTYLDQDITAKVLAAEYGCTEAHLVKSLKAIGPKIDPVFAGLIAVPPQGLRREWVEEAFSIGYQYIGSTRP